MYKSIHMIVLTSIILVSAVFCNFIKGGIANAVETSSVKKVEHKYVCMITNKLFADEQIEVDIEGKKYYGCCEMCKAKLEGDVTSRQAQDPVSGITVDKAIAVTGADSSGNIFYFENETNMSAYNERFHSR